MKYVLILTLLFADLFFLNKHSQEVIEDYLDESILLASGTYATCRLINGGISALQESSVTASPMGLGITFAAGQVLDPINDASERLSDLSVISMGLLASQRLIFTGLNTFSSYPFYLLLIALALSLYYKVNSSTPLLIKLTIGIMLLRLSLPLVCYIGIEADKQYFQPELQKYKAELTQVITIANREFKYEKPELIAFEAKKSDGAWQQFQNFTKSFQKFLQRNYAKIKQRSEAIHEAMIYLTENFSSIAESLAGIFMIILTKIILQVFFLPLAAFLLIRFIFKNIPQFYKLPLKE